MEFRTGNIFKLYGNINIVVSVDDKLTRWISFDSSNCTGVTKNETYFENEMCWDCDTNANDYIDYECKVCKGTGEYKKERLGMDKAEFLADNCKAYIMERLTKNFDF